MSGCCSNPSVSDNPVKAIPIKDMVCYCFQHTQQDIADDYLMHGKSTIEMDVRQKVKDKLCSCEKLNPKGSCCLGDIRKVIKGVELHG